MHLLSQRQSLCYVQPSDLGLLLQAVVFNDHLIFRGFEVLFWSVPFTGCCSGSLLSLVLLETAENPQVRSQVLLSAGWECGSWVLLRLGCVLPFSSVFPMFLSGEGESQDQRRTLPWVFYCQQGSQLTSLGLVLMGSLDFVSWSPIQSREGLNAY